MSEITTLSRFIHLETVIPPFGRWRGGVVVLSGLKLRGEGGREGREESMRGGVGKGESKAPIVMEHSGDG